MRIKIFLFILLALVLFSQPVLSKSYSYDYVKTNLDFGSDGSVTVRQERDYDFRGSFSYAYLDILKKGSSNVRFLGIVDLDTNESLTYDLEDDSTHIKATWYYSANNQVKRFLIVYKIENVVKRYEDVADFYWKVIEDNHERIEKFESYINLPSKSNLFKVFIHSSASPGKLDFLNDLQTAKVAMQNIPANTFVEFRVLAEPSIFSGVEQINSKNYENILNQEKTIFYSTAPPFLRDFYVLIILSIIPTVAFIYFYLKYGRNPKVEYESIYEREPPSKVPSMALSNLLEGQETKTDIRREAMGLLATLFDLARRGYLEIIEEKRKRFLAFDKTEQIFILTKKDKENIDKLESFEKDILYFVFGCGKENDKITSSEIINYCRSNPYKVKDRIEEIDEDSRKWFERKYFPISEKINTEIRERFAFVMTVYIVINIFAIYILMDFAIFLLIIISIFVLFLAVTMSIRTYKSTLEIKKWMAFKKFISDFSAMKDAPAILLKLWDEYLVYAIVLGVAQKLLENIKNLSLETGKPIAAVTWYHGISPISGKTISPDNINSFINNMSHTINALSSSTSVGGGFSGGGGGGGGGGSSGAG